MGGGGGGGGLGGGVCSCFGQALSLKLPGQLCSICSESRKVGWVSPWLKKTEVNPNVL